MFVNRFFSFFAQNFEDFKDNVFDIKLNNSEDIKVVSSHLIPIDSS